MTKKVKSDGSTASYYELPEGATELQHLISHRNMNSQIGEIFRACYRFGLVEHSDMLRDAKKIKFYAQAEIERLERLNGKLGFTDKVIAPTHAYAFTRRPNSPPFRNPPPRTPELGPDVSFDSEHRMDQIGPNGNEGEHYKEVIAGKPSWDDAPDWATHIIYNCDFGYRFVSMLAAGGEYTDKICIYDSSRWMRVEPRPTKELSK